jgi:hypothetical protein
MEKIEATVNAGACGFNTFIEVVAENKRSALLNIKTECPNLKPIENQLKSVDAYKECFAKVGQSGIYQICGQYCKHAACPVPTAILKGIEAACGLALPKNVSIDVRET